MVIYTFSKNKKEKMSTTASSVNPYIIPHTVTSPNASKSAMEAGAARTAHQHAIAEVGRGKVGGGGGGNKKNKKSKKYRKSAMKKRFSKKFRRSILRKKARKLNSRKKNKKALRGGDKLTIPSFSQTSPGGTGIINQLAGNHAQTLSYSKFDGDVSKPASS